MTLRTLTIAAAALALLLPVHLPAQKPDAAQAALKAAMDKELVDGDLKGAIDLFSKVAAAHKTNRAVAAQALFHLGQCYEKLGQAEAASAYDRLVKQYSDQKEAAAARTRLTALRGPAQPVPTSRLAWTMTYTYNLGNVSPDGRYHAYISGPDGGITLRDLQSGETRLIPGAQKNENPYEVVVSRDGKWVAYGGQPGWGLQELRLVSTESGTPRTVFKTGKETNVSWVVPLTWSPDGKEVLVTFNHPEPGLPGYHIGMISVDSGKLRVLKEFEFGFFRWASLSPDGKWVAYNVQTSPDSVECDISVIRTDGTGEHKLIDHPADDIDPHWTPDGRGLVWRSNRRGSIDAFFVAVKDGQLAGSPSLIKTDIQGNLKGVSSSGSVFYEAVNGTQDAHILELDPATGVPRGPARKLDLSYNGRKQSPVVSPDGEWLAFVRPSLTTPRVSYITLKSLRTGQEREIHPKVKYLTSIAWSADGKAIALLARNMRDVHTQYLMDLSTGAVRTVLDKQIHSNYSTGFRAASFSPGNTHFIPPVWGDGDLSIPVVETATLDSRQIFSRNNIRLGRPWFSPDGRFVSFGYESARKFYFAVIDAQSGESRLSREIDSPISQNGWTPDSRHVVLLVRRSGGNEIWRVPIDGGDISKVPLPPPFTFPNQPIVQGNGNFLVQLAGEFTHEIWAVDNCLPRP